MVMRSSDGSVGTSIYEVTGQFHHRYFPFSVASGYHPDGRGKLRSARQSGGPFRIRRFSSTSWAGFS
jgi:hypothetical protein